MPSEQLRFWLEGIGSIAGVAALAAIALELIRARRADVRDFHFSISERFNGIRNERLLLASVEVDSLGELWKILEYDSTFSKAYSNVSNYWDLFARTLRDNPALKKMAIEQFGRLFYQYYEKWSPFQREMAKIEESEVTGYFSHFDWLANEYRVLMPSDLDASKRLEEHRNNWIS